jgi:hypothetical protein
MEKKHYSSLEIYSCCRSCWITVLVLPTHVLEEVIIGIIDILLGWNPLENGDEIHKIFCHFNNSK